MAARHFRLWQGSSPPSTMADKDYDWKSMMDTPSPETEEQKQEKHERALKKERERNSRRRATAKAATARTAGFATPAAKTPKAGTPNNRIIQLMETAKKTGQKITDAMVYAAEDEANRAAILELSYTANRISARAHANYARADRATARAQRLLGAAHSSMRNLIQAQAHVRTGRKLNFDVGEVDNQSKEESESDEEFEEDDCSVRVEDGSDDDEGIPTPPTQTAPQPSNMPKPSSILSPLKNSNIGNLPTDRRNLKKPPPPTGEKEFVVLVTIGDHSEGMRGFNAPDKEGEFIGPTFGEIMEVPAGHFEKFSGTATGTLVLQHGQAWFFGAIKIGHNIQEANLEEQIRAAEEQVNDLETPVSEKISILVEAIYGRDQQIHRIEDLGDSSEPINIAQQLLKKISTLTIADKLRDTQQGLENDIARYKAASTSLQDLQSRRDKLQADPKLVHLEHNGKNETNSVRDIASGDGFSLILTLSGNVFFMGNLYDGFMEKSWGYKRGEKGRLQPVLGHNVLDPLIIYASTKDPCTEIFAGPNYFYLKGESGKLYSAGFATAGQTSRSASTVTATIEGDMEVYTTPYIRRDEGGKDVYDEKAVASVLLPKAIEARFQEANKKRVTSKALLNKCIHLAPGRNHCLGIFQCDDGPRVFAIGSNQDFRSGLDKSVVRADIFTEIAMFRGKNASSAACGDSHSAVLLADGSLYTFGDNSFGQLGLDPKNFKESLPVKVNFNPSRKVAVVSAGTQATLFATPGGSTLTMGEGEETGIDLDQPTKGPLPLELPPLKGYKARRVVAMGSGKGHAGFYLCLEKEKLSPDMYNAASDPSTDIGGFQPSAPVASNAPTGGFQFRAPEANAEATGGFQPSTPVARKAPTGGFKFRVTEANAEATGGFQPSAKPAGNAAFTGGFQFRAPGASTEATGGFQLSAKPAGNAVSTGGFQFRAPGASTVATGGFQFPATTTAASETTNTGATSAPDIWAAYTQANKWKCEVCTLPNDDDKLKCLVCNNEKGSWSCSIQTCRENKPQINSVDDINCIRCTNAKGAWSCGVCKVPNLLAQEKCLSCARPKGAMPKKDGENKSSGN